jgi:hypothetical protein
MYLVAIVSMEDHRMSTATRPTRSRVNPFHQRLGQLTHHQACQMLGDRGDELLSRGGSVFDVDPSRD